MSEETTTEVTRSEEKRRKPPAKREEPEVPSIREEYAIFKTTKEEIQELIECNVGPQGLNEFDLDRIRVPGGETKHWTIPTPEGEDIVKTLEGVVVHYKDVRAWWPDAEPTGQPPQCWSDDGVSGTGMRFPEDDPSESHDCKTCQHAVFGSDPKGGKGQWCKQMRALFILRGVNYLPTAIFLPPTSIRDARKFFLRLLNHGIKYYGVRVAVDLIPDKNDAGQAYNRAELRVVHRLRPEEQDVIASYIAGIKGQLKRVRPMNDAQNATSPVS